METYLANAPTLELCGDLRRDVVCRDNDKQAVYRCALQVEPEESFSRAKVVFSWANALCALAGQNDIVIGFGGQVPVVINAVSDSTIEHVDRAISHAEKIVPGEWEPTGDVWQTEVHITGTNTTLASSVISLFMHDDEATIAYNSSLFVEETIAVLSDRFLHVFNTGVSSMPAAELERLITLSCEPESFRIRGEWDLSEVDGETVVSLFRSRVAQDPHKVAIVSADGSTRMTFEQLDKASDAVATKLIPLTAKVASSQR